MKLTRGGMGREQMSQGRVIHKLYKITVKYKHYNK